MLTLNTQLAAETPDKPFTIGQRWGEETIHNIQSDYLLVSGTIKSTQA